MIELNDFAGIMADSSEIQHLICTDNWISFQLRGYLVQAKVYARPSKYGLDGGRISKMQIKDLGTQVSVYAYDRGLDFDKTTDEIVRTVKNLFPPPQSS